MPYTKSFKIVSSGKAGLTSVESLLVVRGRTSYLRILGGEPRWELMTATASEDDGHFQVCGDKSRLIGSAVRLSKSLGVLAHDTRDWRGREYVKICTIERDVDDDLPRLLNQVIEEFFELFDSAEISNENTTDMIDIYKAISSCCDDDDDVYLGDGLWLSRDGSLNERR